MRHRSRLLVLLAALALGLSLLRGHAAGQEGPATAGWQGPFFFIQMSDPQLGMFTENKDFAQETELFGQAIDAANRLKPAFVVITGDLVHKPGDAAQIAEFKRLTGKLDKSIPLHLVCGNHDSGNVPTTQSIHDYRRDFGKDYYSFDLRGCHFVVLNTTLLHKPDQVPAQMDAQLAFLKADLAQAAAARPRPILVFQHHPLFLAEPLEKDSYHVVPTVRRKPLLELFEQHGVRAVLAGHTHKNFHARSGGGGGGGTGAAAAGAGIEMITSGPVGKPLGKDPSGFRIVKVFEDRIEHEYVGLEAAPQRVTLEAGPR